MRFIKAFPDSDGNCCEDQERDDPCEPCIDCTDEPTSHHLKIDDDSIAAFAGLGLTLFAYLTLLEDLLSYSQFLDFHVGIARTGDDRPWSATNKMLVFTGSENIYYKPYPEPRCDAAGDWVLIDGQSPPEGTPETITLEAVCDESVATVMSVDSTFQSAMQGWSSILSSWDGKMYGGFCVACLLDSATGGAETVRVVVKWITDHWALHVQSTSSGAGYDMIGGSDICDSSGVYTGSGFDSHAVPLPATATFTIIDSW